MLTSPPSATPSSILILFPSASGEGRRGGVRLRRLDAAEGASERASSPLVRHPPPAPSLEREGSGGEYRTNRPVLGKNPRYGSSAYTRVSTDQPSSLTSSCVKASFSPAATRIICSTRSSPVTSSVTGCSTCSRVFISRK